MTANTPAVRTTDTPDNPATSIYHRLARQKDGIARILNDEDTARRLIQLAMTEVRQTPALLECSQESIVGALMLCAQYDLEPGPQQHCYLIPRWNSKTKQKEATWQLGYLGMIELAARAGIQIASDVVREHDHWKHWRTPEGDHFEHARAAGKRGAVVRSYAVARFPDGRPPLVEVCELDDIEQARDRSEQPGGAWKSSFPAMARKTPVRRLFKWIGVSTLRRAAEDDGRAVRVSADAPAEVASGGVAVGLPSGAYEIDDAPELRGLSGGDHEQLRGWGVEDADRHALVWLATDGRTDSSKALTKREHDDFMTLAEEFGNDRIVLIADPDDGWTLETTDGQPLVKDDVLEAVSAGAGEQR